MDTNAQIHFDSSKTFKVEMIDDQKNVWIEYYYEGYGEFGGKDFYELLAEMNGIQSELTGKEYTNYMREKGIDIAFKNNPSGVHTKGVKYPNLIENSQYYTYDPLGPQDFFEDDFEV
jgi:hypothetical protein